MAKVRRIFCGKRRGFLVEHAFSDGIVKYVIDSDRVEVEEHAKLLKVETFFNPPRDDVYRFVIGCVSTPILLLEGRNLEVARISEREYASRPVHLRESAFYRLQIVVPNPVPQTSIELWVEHGEVLDVALPHCYAPSSNFVTVVNVPEGVIELRNLGVVARGRSVKGVAQLDVSHVKQPLECSIVVNGIELAKLTDVWGGDVYALIS